MVWQGRTNSDMVVFSPPWKRKAICAGGFVAKSVFLAVGLVDQEEAMALAGCMAPAGRVASWSDSSPVA